MGGRRGPIGWAWLVAGLLLIGAMGALLLCEPSIHAFVADREQVRAWVEGFGAWAPAIVFGLEVAQVLLAPVPGQAIEAVSGYLFGPWLGLLYAFAGLVAGSLMAFWLARRFGRPLATRLAGPDAVARLDELTERGGSLFFFLIWLFPFVPDDLACLAAGLTPMPTRRFLALMLTGRLPGFLFSVWVGANLVNARPGWWILLFLGLALGAVVLWREGKALQQAILRLIERLSGSQSE